MSEREPDTGPGLCHRAAAVSREEQWWRRPAQTCGLGGAGARDAGVARRTGCGRWLRLAVDRIDLADNDLPAVLLPVSAELPSAVAESAEVPVGPLADRKTLADTASVPPERTAGRLSRDRAPRRATRRPWDAAAPEPREDRPLPIRSTRRGCRTLVLRCSPCPIPYRSRLPLGSWPSMSSIPRCMPPLSSSSTSKRPGPALIGTRSPRSGR